MLALDLQPISAFPLRVVAMQRLLANLIDNVLYHGGGDAEVRTRLFDGRVLLSVLDAAPDYPRRMTATRPHHIGRDLGWWWLNVSCNCMKGVELKSRSGGGLEVLIDLPFTMK